MNLDTLRYLQAFLTARHTVGMEHVDTGVPQGDPLSTLLFCFVMDIVLLNIRRAGYEAAAYADDVAVGSVEPICLDTIEKIYESVGLEINRDKCMCTETSEIEFLGQRFTNEPLAIAEQLEKTAANDAQLLEEIEAGTIH